MPPKAEKSSLKRVRVRFFHLCTADRSNNKIIAQHRRRPGHQEAQTFRETVTVSNTFTDPSRSCEEAKECSDARQQPLPTFSAYSQRLHRHRCSLPTQRWHCDTPRRQAESDPSCHTLLLTSPHRSFFSTTRYTDAVAVHIPSSRLG